MRSDAIELTRSSGTMHNFRMRQENAVDQEHLDDFSETCLTQGVEIELQACEDHVWIGWIARTGKSKGAGATVLEELFEMADDMALPVRCAVDETSDVLIDWYQNLGFEIHALSSEPDGRRGYTILERAPEGASINRQSLQEA